MVHFETFEEAKTFGNEVSNVQQKPFSIYRETKTNKFVIFLTKENFNKYYNVVNYIYAFLCSNYETPFSIGYKLFKHKANKSVVESFATEEKMNKEIEIKRKLGYVITILNSEEKIRKYLEIV